MDRDVPRCAARSSPTLRQGLEDAREERTRRTGELFEACLAAPTESERERLHDEIVCLHLGVARGVAARYRGRGVGQDDLEQTAYTGLVLAVKRFDPRVGDSFLAFALPTMHGLLKHHFRDLGWLVRPPRRLQVLQRQVALAHEELAQRLGRSARPPEIADHLGVEEDEVREAVLATGGYTPVSLDQRVGADGGATAWDLTAAPDHALSAIEARVMLQPLLHRLGERDQRILAMRFFEERTQQEIGNEIGVSQIQVSRLLTRILRDLRRMLTSGDREHQRQAPSHDPPAPSPRDRRDR